MFLKEFIEKGNFEKNIADDKKSLKNYPRVKASVSLTLKEKLKP